jgi:hypothetical protein
VIDLKKCLFLLLAGIGGTALAGQDAALGQESAGGKYTGAAHRPGAQAVGTVLKVSGPLSARKADGSLKNLGAGAEIQPGDTLVTGANTYALIRFIDNSEITLRPGTTFRINDSTAK